MAKKRKRNKGVTYNEERMEPRHHKHGATLIQRGSIKNMQRVYRRVSGQLSPFTMPYPFRKSDADYDGDKD